MRLIKNKMNQSMSLTLGCVSAEYLFQKLWRVLSKVRSETSSWSVFLLIFLLLTLNKKDVTLALDMVIIDIDIELMN